MKYCFKFKITLSHLVSSYIFKTMPNGAKVKMTFSIGCDVSKQTLTLTRTQHHFKVLLSCISYENIHYYPQNLFSERDGSKVNHIWLSFMQVLREKHHLWHHFTHFSIAVDDKMATKIFSSQNKSSSSERDFLTPCNMHLTPCNMQKILHGYSSAKWMGIFLGI